MVVEKQDLTQIVSYKRIGEDIAIVELGGNKSVLYECRGEDILYRDFMHGRTTYSEMCGREFPSIDVSREISATSIYTQKEGRLSRQATIVFDKEDVACKKYLQEVHSDIDTLASEMLEGTYDVVSVRPKGKLSGNLLYASLLAPIGAVALLPTLAYALIKQSHGSGYPFMGALMAVCAPFFMIKEALLPNKVERLVFPDADSHCNGPQVFLDREHPYAYVEFQNMMFQISGDNQHIGRIPQESLRSSIERAGRIHVDKVQQHKLESLVEEEKRFPQEHRDFFAALTTQEHEQILMKVI
jgi:hypothetical protein